MDGHYNCNNEQNRLHYQFRYYKKSRKTYRYPKQGYGKNFCFQGDAFSFSVVADVVSEVLVV